MESAIRRGVRRCGCRWKNGVKTEVTGGEAKQRMGVAMRKVLAAVLAVGVQGLGAFELREGDISVEDLHGAFVQWGGTAWVTRITHEPGNAFHHDTIDLHDGRFHSGEINCQAINGYLFFTQTGGRHVNSNGIVLASSLQRFVNRGSQYVLEGGTLRTPSVALAGGPGDIGGVFAQSGGRATAEDFYVAGGGNAQVSGGTLTTTTLTVNGVVQHFNQSGVFYSYATFAQTGGEVVANQRLSVGTGYTFAGGSLTATRIAVGNAAKLVIETNGLVNGDRVFLSGGRLEARSTCQLGRLALRTYGETATTSDVVFAGGRVVQFRNSSVVPWDKGALLVVRNWVGATRGGGASQLRFGQNKQGLTTRQLGQIVFENPVNSPEGDYTARMLATGEVVPHVRTALRLASAGS